MSKPDFGGYATKVGLKCSDGRTILQDAFHECDGKTVPLVYQHLHDDVTNILGHAILRNRKDGVYAECYLNDTEKGSIARELIKHGDISALSIYANSLVEKSKNIIHGVIREVSLVIAGANPEAYIDNIAFSHGDGSIVTSEDDAIISAGPFSHDALDLEEEESKDSEALSHVDKSTNNETIGEVFNTLSEKQKTAVYAMIAGALEDGEDAKHSNIEGEEDMKKNIFDKEAAPEGALQHDVLTREQLRTIISDAKNSQSTLKNAFLAHGFESIADAYSAYEGHQTTTGGTMAHAATYGIDQIDMLFPDYKATSNTPAFLKRRTEWVSKVFGQSKHVPFSRIKTIVADITADEARARGYVKGNKKVDEVITLLKRTTDPQTINVLCA